jgi:hypothetical protein
VIVAACALIGRAHAFDMNAYQATHALALAMLADYNCPGITLNNAKVARILVQAGITDPTALQRQIKSIQIKYFEQFGTDRRKLCDFARDRDMPMRLMLDIE